MDSKLTKYITSKGTPNWFEIITNLIPFVNLMIEVIFKKREKDTKLEYISKLIDLYPPEYPAQNLIKQIKIVLNEKDIL